MDQPLTRRQALGALGALAVPLELLEPSRLRASAQADPGPDEAPDLGNLYGVVEWIRREHAPALSFLDARWRALDAWKAEARAAVHRHLSFQASPLPVRGEIVASEDRGTFRIETVRIHATSAYEIPGRLLIPAGRQAPGPAVLALHCHGGQYQWGAGKLVSSAGEPSTLVDYRDALYGRAYAEELARRGFVVMVIDAFYFGERRLQVAALDPAVLPAEAREHHQMLKSIAPASREWFTALNRIAGALETVVAKTLFAAGATWPGLLVWDDRRSLDYLASRSEVDPERIGCVGLSGGALRAVHLVAADGRLRAACIVAWMTEFGELLPQHVRRHTWMAYLPGMYTSLDLPDEVALLAPGALMVQQCEHDTLFPRAGMQGALDKLQKIYTKARIPERFRGTFYDEPHSFTPRMQEDAFAWLERWL